MKGREGMTVRTSEGLVALLTFVDGDTWRRYAEQVSKKEKEVGKKGDHRPRLSVCVTHHFTFFASKVFLLAKQVS